MPLDPILTDDTLQWLRKANDDLRAAQALIDIEPPLFSEVAFHCQQAIEKAEKGFLYWHQQSFQKTHDLYLLGLSCCEIDSSLSDIIKPTAKLTEYAVEYRYPSSLSHPSRSEIDEMIDLAEAVLAEIANRLPVGV